VAAKYDRAYLIAMAGNAAGQMIVVGEYGRILSYTP
jgi:hypothetical protein